MTEKDKMLAGKPYLAFDKELFLERQNAKELLFEINHLPPSDLEKRKTLFKKLLGKTNGNFHIEQPFFCDYGNNIEVGKNFYANHNCIILDCAKVKIGDNVLLAPNVSLFTVGHPIDAEKRNEGWEYAFPITIGNNVWVGGNTVINAGITIGDNVVIGSGSVVTKDIPANTLAMGNPCRVYREITEEDKKYYFKKLEF